MKILDRYVLATFLKNYLISLMVLIGLYIMLDLVFNFDELVEVQSKGAAVAASGGGASFLHVVYIIWDYYFYQSFLIFAQLSGVIPVVAAAFTLVRFARFNELSPILSAGVSLFRTAAPIIIAGIVLSFLLLVDQEMIIPRLIPKLTRTHDQIGQQAPKSFDIKAMQDGSGGLLFASRYLPPTDKEPATIIQLDVIERDKEYRPTGHISADKAVWDAEQNAWKLTGGRHVTGLQPNQQQREDPKPPHHYKSGVTPEEVALFHSGDYTELLSTARINQLLQRPQSYGTIDLLRVKHARVTQSVMNVVAVLLAIGTILTREPGTLKGNALRLLIVVGAAMSCVFLCHQLAAHPPSGQQWADRWPAIMAWLPIFMFFPLAIFLLDQLQTKKS